MGFKRRQIKTKRGYDLFEVASALQKTIRRNEIAVAGYFALELYHSGFSKYAWKRLLTISAEDCAGIITREIKSLMDCWVHINKATPKGQEPKGRIFMTKAVMILAMAPKNRDSDHLQNLVYDKNDIDMESVKSFLEDVEDMEHVPIPDYAFDVHTRKGKMRGKTKDDFFRDELLALKPRQTGIFDSLVK